jgi:hypothetical protein
MIAVCHSAVSSFENGLFLNQAVEKAGPALVSLHIILVSQLAHTGKLATNDYHFESRWEWMPSAGFAG